MADVIDNADLTIEHNLAANIAASLSKPARPAGLVPRGSCWECDMEFEDNVPRLFCAAEPGQRESDCTKQYNKRMHQLRSLGRL